jgi:hypothetical protein
VWSILLELFLSGRFWYATLELTLVGRNDLGFLAFMICSGTIWTGTSHTLPAMLVCSISGYWFVPVLAGCWSVFGCAVQSGTLMICLICWLPLFFLPSPAMSALLTDLHLWIGCITSVAGLLLVVWFG